MGTRGWAAVGMALVFAVGCGSSGGDDQQQQRAEQLCQESAARKLLTNADSATFRTVTSEALKWPAEGGGEMDYWRVRGEISGENAFGARVAFKGFGCVMVPRGDRIDVDDVYFR